MPSVMDCSETIPPSPMGSPTIGVAGAQWLKEDTNGIKKV